MPFCKGPLSFLIIHPSSLFLGGRIEIASTETGNQLSARPFPLFFPPFHFFSFAPLPSAPLKAFLPLDRANRKKLGLKREEEEEGGGGWWALPPILHIQ